MTEEQLYEQLMIYKNKHGITEEVLQQYRWALDHIKKHNTINKPQNK